MAEDTVEGEGAAMVMGDIGEINLDLGIRGTFMEPDGGDMGRTGEAIILIIMEATPIPVMDT